MGVTRPSVRLGLEVNFTTEAVPMQDLARVQVDSESLLKLVSVPAFLGSPLLHTSLTCRLHAISIPGRCSSFHFQRRLSRVRTSDW